MNWEQITALCQTELLKFRRELPEIATFFPQPDHVATAFIDHERDTNDAVEMAVRQFAADRTWPAMTPIERTMLSFRLDFAASVATLLAQQPAPWTDTEDSHHDEERIGWLMLFAWGEEGFSTLHNNLRRLVSHETVA